MSLYVTGDCHAEFSRFDLMNEKVPLTKDDIIIIAGDMGLPWGEFNSHCIENSNLLTKWSENDRLRLKFLNSFPCTFLFVDGNHENFDLIEQAKVEILYGGQVHKIGKNVYHLMRGEVFTIMDHTFFVMGGATSIDKAYRRAHISWWPQEIPNTDDWHHAFETLDKYNWTVDYVVTHTCPDKFLNNRRDFDAWPDNCPVRQMLNRIEPDIKRKHWFFGHYHENYKDLEEQCTWLYGNIEQIL